MTNRIVELFGRPVEARLDWAKIVGNQSCPFTAGRCVKTRKSDPSTAIGTCVVLYGQPAQPIMICPHRLLSDDLIFRDAVPLLGNLRRGDDLRLVREVQLPGGSVDYFLVSVRGGAVHDFVGIELQTLDTTGTVWPERQRLITSLGIKPKDREASSSKKYGMNWKMTAKTILVQLHHKVETLEHIGKKLVLVVQDVFCERMLRDFRGAHLNSPAHPKDAFRIHSYKLSSSGGEPLLSQAATYSTDSKGVAKLLGTANDQYIDASVLEAALASKLRGSARLR